MSSTGGMAPSVAARYSRSMSKDVQEPDDCTTLADVAAGLEAVDRALIAHLAKRLAYVRAAARFKPDKASVSDETTHRTHLEAARRLAFDLGVPVGLVVSFWERLIDVSIALEHQAWDRLRKGEGSD